MFQKIFGKSAIAAGLVLASQSPAAHATEFKPLYSFSGTADGSSPFGTLTADAVGNLYGTTEFGGRGRCDQGCGNVFALAPDGSLQVRYEFRGRAGGGQPSSGLVADAEGNLYGMTSGNGRHDNGVVFKVTPDGQETVLHTFGSDMHDGVDPEGGLIADAQGNLYGTTATGGDRTACTFGCGTIFRISPDGTEKVLYAFKGGTDGQEPDAALIADKKGNLYGTTMHGGGAGCSGFGCGTVFKLDRHRNETVLHAFAGGSDGAEPAAPLVADRAGNLYGTTTAGGANSCSGGMCGTVFKLTPAGIETVLHVFTGGSDGNYPVAGLVVDRHGNLFGTTFDGGLGCSAHNCGTVFEVAPDGTETILHAFTGADDGAYPAAALIEGEHHEFYGTASWAGSGGAGVVFEIKP